MTNYPPGYDSDAQATGSFPIEYLIDDDDCSDE